MKPLRAIRLVPVLGTLLLTTVTVAAAHARQKSAKAQPFCPPFVSPTIDVPPTPCGGACGIERWSVKTLRDRDRSQVDLTPRRSTVTELGRLPVPVRRPSDRRAGPSERRVFCVEGWVVEPPRPQDDGDIHIVLAGVEDTSSRMIVEIPDVRCAGVCDSRFAEAFARARETTERRLRTYTTDTLRIVVVGVGFFDRKHNQYGAAPNSFELHPVLAVRFP